LRTSPTKIKINHLIFELLFDLECVMILLFFKRRPEVLV